MKDAYELLREKETVIVRLRQEIEALRCVIPLLLDDRHQADDETSELQAPILRGPELLETNSGRGGSFWVIGVLHECTEEPVTKFRDLPHLSRSEFRRRKALWPPTSKRGFDWRFQARGFDPQSVLPLPTLH